MSTYTIGILIIIGLLFHGIFSHIVSLLGDKKNIGYTNTLAISFFLSPLIGLLFVIASNKKESEVKTREEILLEIKHLERLL